MPFTPVAPHLPPQKKNKGKRIVVTSTDVLVNASTGTSFDRTVIVTGSPTPSIPRRDDGKKPMESISAHVFGFDDDCVVVREEPPRMVFPEVKCFYSLSGICARSVSHFTNCFTLQGSEQVCSELNRIAYFIRDATSQFASVTEVQRMVEGQRSRLTQDLKSRDAEVASLRKSEGTAVAKAEAQALKLAALGVEVTAQKAREDELVISQAGVIQAVVEKLLRSNWFSTLASTLGSLLAIPVKASTLDAVVKEYPDVDKSKFRFEVRTDKELLSCYTASIVDFAGSFPHIQKLCSSTEFLTSGVVF